MRKYLAVILASMLCLSLCACTGGTASEGVSESSAISESASKTEISGSKEEVSKSESSVSGSEVSTSEGSVSGEEASKSESSVSGAEVSKNESSGAEASKSESSAEESLEESSAESFVESSEESSEVSLEESSEESIEESSTEESAPQESSREQSRPQPQPAGAPVESSWFDDALFIGDSVTLKLSYYSDYGSLGNAEFLCAGSLGYNNAQMGLYESGNVHPEYRGEKVLVDEGAAIINPAKIFIMLGMNDIGLYGVDGAVEGMKVITDRIASKCPNAVIYVQSVTPMLENMQLSDLNNRTIAEFNSKIQPICEQRGYKYLDIASAMDDGRGNLVYEYCGDPTAMGLHFSDKGCEVWVDYLKTHVGQ